MSVERVVHCDAADCERHVKTASPPPYVPGFFIETRESGDNADEVRHFCSWDCVLKYAAGHEPEQVIPWTEGEMPDFGGDA